MPATAILESAGVSPLASGFTGIFRFFDGFGSNGLGPEAGPIDWDGSGSIDGGLVSVDLNGVSGSAETMTGYADWIHGACTTSADCRINAIRQQIHDLQDTTVDPHEPCVNGRCQSFIYPFQCFR